MKKAAKKSTHDKKSNPMKVPAPRMADESKPIKEAVTPAADQVHGYAEHDCKRIDCKHPGAMHYGSPERWCNTSGCGCLAFL